MFSDYTDDDFKHELSKADFTELLIAMTVCNKDSLIFSEIPGNLDNWTIDHSCDMGAYDWRDYNEIK